MSKTVADVLIGKACEIAELHYRIEGLVCEICRHCDETVKLNYRIEGLIGEIYRLRDEIAGLQCEIGRLSRAYHDLRHPEKPLDPEMAAAMVRLSNDYHRYRLQGDFQRRYYNGHRS